MIKTLRDALKVKEIRTRLWYTFFILVLVRVGTQLPLPFADYEAIKDAAGSLKDGAFSFFNAMTGGSYERYSVFTLSITPYITSSIIMQLLTIAIPKLEEMQKDGEDGRKKITEITRYVTIVLSLIQSTAMAINFYNGGIFGSTVGNSTLKHWGIIIVAIAVMTAGSAILMWMGENVTEKGLGNGISVILLINIVSTMPDDFIALFEKFVLNASSKGAAGLSIVIIFAVVAFVVGFVVLLNGGERRISVQYSKKMQGRKVYGGQSTHIPLKVNTAGVIPIIFAQSLLTFPAVIFEFVKGSGSAPEWTHYLSSSYWFRTGALAKYSVGFILYIVLVVAFAYFYTSITFNPIEVADNMKKQGGFIPGIRPGKPTQDYLNAILNNLVFIGAVGLILVATVPLVISGVFNASLSFGGTSLIIIVGVILETMKQVESLMVVRSYQGFLNI